MRFPHEQQPQNQTSLNFPDSFIEDQQVYELERKNIADKHHVANPLLIEKRGDVWCMKSSGITVEEWDRVNNVSDTDWMKGQR